MDKLNAKLEELGEVIATDPRRINWMEAKEAQENDAVLQAQMADFSTMRTRLMNASGDPEEAGKLGEQLGVLYEGIMKHPLMEGYVNAQQGLNEMMQLINSRISFFVTGEEAGCSGDCGSCGGGCPA